MVLTQIAIPTKYQYLIGISNLIMVVGPLILLLILCVDAMHSPIYHPALAKC